MVPLIASEARYWDSGDEMMWLPPSWGTWSGYTEGLAWPTRVPRMESEP